MEHLYFAYGSNMDPEQMERRCPGATCIGIAVLAGWMLTFAGSSRRWGGGVATVTPSDDSARVPGVLWLVTHEDLAELDGYEGHPFAYRRMKLTTWTATGRPRKAHCYVKQHGVIAPPTREYAQRIARGYRAAGLNLDTLTTALDKVERATKERRAMEEKQRERVFVYGSLRSGHWNHGWLGDAEYDGLAQTRAGFTMYSLGSFPAVVPGGYTAIKGEVYSVDKHTLAELDRLEGHPKFYRRERVLLADDTVAWIYLLHRNHANDYRRAGTDVVECGDWNEHEEAQRYLYA